MQLYAETFPDFQRSQPLERCGGQLYPDIKGNWQIFEGRKRQSQAGIMLGQLTKTSFKSERSMKSQISNQILWREIPVGNLTDWSAKLEAASCSYRQFPFWAKAYEVEHHKVRFFYCGSKDRPTAFAAIVEVGIYPFRFGLIDRGPFFFAPEHTDIPACLSGLVELFKKQGYVFVRFTQGQEVIFEEVRSLTGSEQIEPYPFCRDSRNSMLIGQKPEESDTIQSFSETARQEIRRAVRFNYDIRSTDTDADFETAWQMFENLARKKGFILSPRPKKFWREVLRLGSQENRARLYLCSDQRELIAAQLDVRDGAICEVMLASLDREALGKKPSPAALMFFKGMRFGYEFGCRLFNIGGPGDPKRNNHLFEFKRKFKPTLHVTPEPLCLVLAPRRYRLWMNIFLRGWRAWRSRFGNNSVRHRNPKHQPNGEVE